MKQEKILLKDAPSRAKRLLSNNDIVYSSVRPANRHYGFFSNPLPNLVVSTGFIVITCNEKKIYPLFLYYYLIQEQIVEELHSIAEGSTSAYPSLLPTDIESMVISIPSTLHEQRAIATVLSSLDDKIDLLHRQNATLEAMAEALFKQWFVVKAKAEWEETTIEDAIIFYDSQRIPLSQTERDKKKAGELYPYYGAAQIMDYINEYIFDGDYLLIAEDGTVRNELGFPILQRAYGKFWVNNHTHIIQAKQPYTNDFIYIYLLKKNIDEIITGAVQPKISHGNLKRLQFFKYPHNLVLEYNNLIKPFFERIRSNRIQINTLEKLRDMLLPKLMNGEVRVGF